MTWFLYSPEHFIANVFGGMAGAQLGYLAEELAVYQVGFRFASQGTVTVDDLPMAYGVLEFLGELLRVRCGYGYQREDCNCKGVEEFGQGRFHKVTPCDGLIIGR